MKTKQKTKGKKEKQTKLLMQIFEIKQILHTIVLCTLGYNTTVASSRRKRSTQTNLVEYGIGGVTTGCRVWNQDVQQWDKTSCKVNILALKE